DETLATAYVNGDVVTQALRRALATAQIASLCGRPAQSTSFDWIASSAAAAPTGVSAGLDTASSTSTAASPKPYAAQLVDVAPAGVLAFVSFNGSGGAGLAARFQQQCPGLARRLRPLETVAGVRLADVAQLLGGESALYVRPGARLPEISLLLRPP